MIKINLLPVREERRKADVQQFAVMLVGALVLSIAIAGFFHWRMLSKLDEAQMAIVQTQSKIDQLGPQLAKVQQYRETKNAIEKKLGVIEELDDSRSGPVHVLDELATHAPERLWIQRIEAANRQITIHGMSLDNELVALFLTALNDSPYFKTVELRETEAKERDGFKLNHFEVTALITSPAAEKRAAEKAKAAAAAAETASTGGVPLGTGR
ncbi:MAG: PilN domain-containing protein [Myxococcota bacterium]|nr:PilN domain-containing protein [Myxococcota bacterium]